MDGDNDDDTRTLEGSYSRLSSLRCVLDARNQIDVQDAQTNKKKRKQLTKEAVAYDKSYDPPHPTNCIRIRSGRGF